MKKVQAQRKFAQGVYMPSPNINTVIEKRSDVGTGKDPKNVFHNNTSAKTLLDMVSFKSLHTHTPIVLLERLREDNLIVANNNSESHVNSNNNLQKNKTKKLPKYNYNLRVPKIKNSESMNLRSKTRLATPVENKNCSKKLGIKKDSKITKKKAKRIKRTVEIYQSEDETPLKFLSKAGPSKENPPSSSSNKATMEKQSNNNLQLTTVKARISNEEPLSSHKGISQTQTKNDIVSPVSLPNYENSSVVRDTENRAIDFLSSGNDIMEDISEIYDFDQTEHSFDETEYESMDKKINPSSEFIVLRMNNHTTDNIDEVSMNNDDHIIDTVNHTAYITNNIVENTEEDINVGTNLIQNSDPVLIQNNESNHMEIDTCDDMDYSMDSLPSEQDNLGNELESVNNDTERDSDALNLDDTKYNSSNQLILNYDDSMDVVEEEDNSNLDDRTFNEIAQWLGMPQREPKISEGNACLKLLDNNNPEKGIKQEQQAKKPCRAISMKNLCKMLTRSNNANEFVDFLKEKFKNKCFKCKNCQTTRWSCKIIKLLKDHQENFHQEHLCRLACIRKTDKELVTIDLTDSSSTKNLIVEMERNEYSLLAVIKENLIEDSESTAHFSKIKNITRDIILGMNNAVRSDSPISDSNSDSDAASESDTSTHAPIMTRRRGQTLNPQPGPSGIATSVIRSKLVDAPVFHPTKEEFQDPIAYFEKIMPIAAKFGLCKVVSPDDFQPACNLNDDMRFTLIHQYIARVFNRWGDNTRQLCAIRASAAAQKVVFARPPLVGGIELDLVKMFKAVQREGGIKALNKKKWQKIAEELHCTAISNPDKVLDSLYLKCLVPYNSYSKRSRQECINDLEVLWRKRNQNMLERAMNPLHRQKRLLGEADSSSDEEVDDEADPFMTSTLKEIEDCVVKGRSTDLGNFKRVARNASRRYFPKGGSAAQIETSYWKIVEKGDEHVCVDSASIDTGSEGYGFTKNQYEPYGNHPWNLKMLSQNKGNVLRLLGSVIGLTVPTLHLGMVYSTSCWHRDPHGLPWIEYMHDGVNKIWYGISDEESYRFRKGVENLSPTSCQNKSIWLPSDITMIPPKLLLEQGVSLSKVVQKPGEFVIVFPKSYSCSISTAYTVSESVYFATNSWVNSIHQVFQELRDSCEPTMFSLEHLLFSAARDSRASPTMLQLVCTKLISIVNEEIDNRNKAMLKGLTPSFSRRRNNTTWSALADDECQICRTTLYLSRVKGVFQRSLAVCVTHALRALDDPKISKREVATYEFEVFFANSELEEIINIAKKRLVNVKPRR